MPHKPYIDDDIYCYWMLSGKFPVGIVLRLLATQVMRERGEICHNLTTCMPCPP